MKTEQPAPPRAPKRPVTRTLHGDTFVDDYAWLKDITREDPEVLAHLEAENAYTAAVLRHTEALQEQMFEEMKARIKETDQTAPVQDGGFFYYSRIEEGWQYWMHCRKSGSIEAPEEVLLDENALAESHEQFDLGVFKISPNHRLLAYAFDTDGSEVFTLHVLDLETRALYPERIPGIGYTLVWANDNETLFYATMDDAHRPYRLWRHRLGTDPSEDVLVHGEPDQAFYLSADRSRSDRFIFLSLASNVTSEISYLPADDPDGAFTVIDPRANGVEYDVEHQGDRLLIRTNKDAKDFRLLSAPLSDMSSRTELLPHRPGVTLEAVDGFADHVVLTERERGLRRLRVIRVDDGDDHVVEVPEPVYSIGVGPNPRYDTTTLRFGYASMVTPQSAFDYDMNARTRALVKQQEVPNYDPAQYRSERIFARASDGTEVPISIVMRRDRSDDGSAPLWLYGYGSYGLSMDAGFSALRVPLLERGFAFAIAHIRGGGDLGETWRDDGKLANKMNTFTDYIASAEHLRSNGYGNELVFEGGSAGGLLMGAVTNLRPDLPKAVIAAVPFVDVINTIMDPNLLFSVMEYEEWGNPNIAEQYGWIRAYSPYENVRAQSHPHILAIGGLNDPRVNYWEPAKWVARLRDLDSSGNRVLLKTKMVSGHSGASGRYDAIKDRALIYAFALDVLGMSPENIERPVGRSTRSGS
ncbi:MAG: S9 family peptidase [Actinobacteria bacterium]|nr:S9 family peptidase [Actinomycetota bacterium]